MVGAKNNRITELLSRIPFKFAVNTIVFILISVLVYHLLIISGVISYEVVWGGRLENQTQMIRFETISIAINLLMLLVVCIKGRIISVGVSPKIIKILLYCFAVLFTLNTIGNIFSKNIWEAIIFTPMTLILAILFARLAVDRAGESAVKK